MSKSTLDTLNACSKSHLTTLSRLEVKVGGRSYGPPCLLLLLTIIFLNFLIFSNNVCQSSPKTTALYPSKLKIPLLQIKNHTKTVKRQDRANKMIGPTDPTIIEYFIHSVLWKVNAEIVVILCNRGTAVELFTFKLIK